MRQRSLIVIIALLAWLTGFTCTLPAFAHACCRGETQAMRPDAACCQILPQAQAQPSEISSSAPNSGIQVFGPPTHRLALLSLTDTIQHSRLAASHVPDQSDRHLELSVLLN